MTTNLTAGDGLRLKKKNKALFGMETYHYSNSDNTHGMFMVFLGWLSHLTNYFGCFNDSD